MNDPARILLVRLSHLGDVVSALGVFHALHAAYPRAELAWAVQPEFADLVRGLPGLARTIAFERRGGWRAWRRLRAELRAFRPDLTVDAQANFKSAAVTLLSGAPRRAGLARSDWREGPASLAINDPAPAVPRGLRHAQERMRVLAAHVAPGAPRPAPADPGLSAAERAQGRALLERHAGPRAGVLLHLSTPGDVRSLPLEHWLALALALRERGAEVLVLAGPREAEAGRALAARLPADGVRSWIGQSGLRELAAFFAAAAEAGWRLVACDSGPMHLACACGLSAVVLAGPQDEARTGPWPADAGHRVVRARPGPPCAPCLRRRCTHPRGPVCMESIEVPQILGALDGSAARA